MPSMRSLLASLLLAAASTRPLAAQRVPEIIDEAVRIGSHVRLSTITGKTYMGTVSHFSADTIALNVSGAVGKLPTAAIQRLELRIGKRSGYTIGAIAGGLIGGAGLFMLERSTESKCGCTKKAPARIGATVGGTAVGVALGAVLGAAVRRDRWREVALPRP